MENQAVPDSIELYSRSKPSIEREKYMVEQNGVIFC